MLSHKVFSGRLYRLVSVHGCLRSRYGVPSRTITFILSRFSRCAVSSGHEVRTEHIAVCQVDWVSLRRYQGYLAMLTTNHVWTIRMELPPKLGGQSTNYSYFDQNTQTL